MQTVIKTGTQSSGDPFEFILSTEDVDRAGDIVRQVWELSAFNRNPIALWAHDHERPIGSWVNVGVKGGKLTGRLTLAERGTSSFIDMLRGLVEQRILRAVSVGFKPLARELRLDQNERVLGYTFTKSELLEGSLVSVPANANALALAKSLGGKERDMKAVFAFDGPMADPRYSETRKRAEAALKRARAALGSAYK